MAIYELDRIDKNILRELQANGRISNVALAKRVGLSATPCLNRVKRLESLNCIQQYTIKVNPKFMSASILVFVEVRLDRTSKDAFNHFRKSVLKVAEIMECHLVSGDFDYLLKARVPDMSAYRNFLGDTLLYLPHINSTRTYIVMEEVKDTTMNSVL